MNDNHPHQAYLALTGFTVSVGGATVAWLSQVEQFLRIGSSIIAIAAGITSIVYYGKQNKWWK
jgi:hypothetical protein